MNNCQLPLVSASARACAWPRVQLTRRLEVTSVAVTSDVATSRLLRPA